MNRAQLACVPDTVPWWEQSHISLQEPHGPAPEFLTAESGSTPSHRDRTFRGARPDASLTTAAGIAGPVRDVADPRGLVEDFRHVAELAGTPLADTDIVIQPLPAPHEPPTSLPLGWMAVYAFSYHGAVLKIGKAGPNNSRRYTQDYIASSSGTLAARLLKGGNSVVADGLTRDSVGDWISTNTSRLNVLLRTEFDTALLTLLKAFLECRLRPSLT